MKKITSSIAIAALAAAAIFATGSGASAQELQGRSVHSFAQEQQGDLADALVNLDQRVEPIAVRLTEAGVEKDYAFGTGSVLTVIETPAVAGGGSAGRAAAINVGSDFNGQYIQFSPADQSSFINGGSTLLLGSLGLLLGPLGAVVLGALGAAIGPQIEQHTCAAQNKSIRFTYTLDGNITNSRCV